MNIHSYEKVTINFYQEWKNAPPFARVNSHQSERILFIFQESVFTFSEILSITLLLRIICHSQKAGNIWTLRYREYSLRWREYSLFIYLVCRRVIFFCCWAAFWKKKEGQTVYTITHRRFKLEILAGIWWMVYNGAHCISSWFLV